MKAAEVLRSVNDFEELGGLDGDNQLPISSVTVNICLIFVLFVSYLFHICLICLICLIFVWRKKATQV